MKVIDYIRDYTRKHPGYQMHLPLCEPYIHEDGTSILVRDGIAEVILTPTNPAPIWNDDDRFPDVMENLALKTDPNFAPRGDYDVYDVQALALARMQSVGCLECPLRETCESMNEEI